MSGAVAMRESEPLRLILVDRSVSPVYVARGIMYTADEFYARASVGRRAAVYRLRNGYVIERSGAVFISSASGLAVNALLVPLNILVSVLASREVPDGFEELVDANIMRVSGRGRVLSLLAEAAPHVVYAHRLLTAGKAVLARRRVDPGRLAASLGLSGRGAESVEEYIRENYERVTALARRGGAHPSIMYADERASVIVAGALGIVAVLGDAAVDSGGVVLPGLVIQRGNIAHVERSEHYTLVFLRRPPSVDQARRNYALEYLAAGAAPRQSLLGAIASVAVELYGRSVEALAVFARGASDLVRGEGWVRVFAVERRELVPGDAVALAVGGGGAGRLLGVKRRLAAWLVRRVRDSFYT